jgi:tellurium resistance protein TerD
MATINLSKGQRADIGLRKVSVGLGWDPNTGLSQSDFDLDASAFLLGANGKCPAPEFFVFYNNPTSSDGSTASSGDNRGGQGDGDDETISVDLGAVSPQIEQIIFAITIHEAEQRKQNFGQVRNSFIRVYDAATKEEICKYELDEDFSTATALEFGRLYKRNDAWRFEATGLPVTGGLDGFIGKYC